MWGALYWIHIYARKVYGPAAHTEVYVKNTQHVQKAGIPRNQTGVYYKLQSLTTCCAHMKNTPSLHRNKPRIICTSINIKGVFWPLVVEYLKGTFTGSRSGSAGVFWPLVLEYLNKKSACKNPHQLVRIYRRVKSVIIPQQNLHALVCIFACGFNSGDPLWTYPK